MGIPGVTRECFLEALRYLKTSKQHPLETPGRCLDAKSENESRGRLLFRISCSCRV